MWYAINWLCAFCMTLFFQYNNGIWYGGNYINSCLKPKEELEEFKPGIQTSGNLLQSYRDQFRPIFRHQHSTLIKYPLVQQTDKMDFNYYNNYLTAREKKFEQFPPYNFRIGKNRDSYYSTKCLLPNYKVLINPFYSKMNFPSKIGEGQYFVNTMGDTFSNRRPLEPEIKFKGTRDSQYYNYGVKKRKHIHGKKQDENDKLIYPRKIVGGLFLPSKIILDNFSSWKWKNKKEIQTNNLSLSMVYDLLLPKSTARKPNKKIDSLCHTTKKRKINVYDESSEYQCISPTKTMLESSSCLIPNERLMHLNKKTQLNTSIHQEETTDESDNSIHRSGKCGKNKEIKFWYNETKHIMSSTCYSDCGCRTKYKYKIPTECLTSLAISSEVPIVFHFEDYLCKCYSTASTTPIPVKRRKVNGTKSKIMKHKGKETNNSSTSKVPEMCLKINNEANDLLTEKEHLVNPIDDLNVAQYIIISNDGVIDPENDDYLNFDFENISSLNCFTDSLNINECSTKISRTKRRTFKCKSKWNSKRKRAFVPIYSYHDYLFKKPNANFITSFNTTHLKNRNFRIKKINKSINRPMEKKQKNIIHKGLNLRVSKKNKEIKRKPEFIGASVENEKNREHKKREFIGESQFNASYPCWDYEEISTSTRSPSSSLDSVKTTLLITDIEIEKSSYSTLTIANTEKPSHSTVIIANTEKPTYSTFVKSHPFLSKATGLIFTHKTTPYALQIFERSTEMIWMQMPKDLGPILRPDTGNRHPAKLKCEQQYNRECICYVKEFLEGMNNLISINQDQKFLLNQLTKYKCTHYRPMDINYKMSPELKPRLISKKHKELIADEKNGPKEIIDETFQELMTRDVPNQETDFYIFPNSNVEIPCFVNNDVQLSPNTADSASYVWRQGDNKIITGGRVTEDLNHRGFLQIAEATIADSDNYTCTVNYTNPDTGQTVTDSFVHSVMVVTLPKLALHTLLHYTAKVRCDQETLEMFELYHPQQVEDYICYIEPDRKKICTVEIHNPICHPKNNEEHVENTMELSQNFELDVGDVTQTMISAANHTRCGPFCQLKIILKVVDILRESFTIVLPHPVTSSAGATFKPDINSLNVKILIACEGGFKLVQGFCMPCPANTYSEEGSTECSKCRSGTYQPNIGSRTCEPCPHPFRTGCSSLWFSPGVIALTILIILLTILISTAMVYACKFCIAKCLLPCLSPCTVGLFTKKKGIIQEKLNPRKIFKKKMRKSAPQVRMEDTTEPPTPPAEDFTS